MAHDPHSIVPHDDAEPEARPGRRARPTPCPLCRREVGARDLLETALALTPQEAKLILIRTARRIPQADVSRCWAETVLDAHPVARDEGHGFQKKRNQGFQFYATVAFIQRHLLK